MKIAATEAEPWIMDQFISEAAQSVKKKYEIILHHRRLFYQI